jgi:hypothetical protein
MANTRSLLSSQARIQAPWIKVQIGNYSFGVFDKKTKRLFDTDTGSFYQSFNLQYPNYIQSLNIVKINGQVNQYTLTIIYPIRVNDDPNFFEKVFSSVSGTRKIVFSYGDSSMPTYVYKDEEAIITGITQQFNLEQSSITYTVKAVSSAIVGKTGAYNFMYSGTYRPSDLIKQVFMNKTYGLQSIFTGMGPSNYLDLIQGDDKAVPIGPKTNMAPLDYIAYLVSCMVPASASTNNLNNELYILTIHDDTVYDRAYNDTLSLGGPYFKVTKTSSSIEQADAYEVDIGYNTANIVLSFNIENNENYSLFYDYNEELHPEKYVRRLNNSGGWEDVYAPIYTSGNSSFSTTIEATNWFTKVTKYPISATLKIQGLLRPAQLMQYLRLNVVFPGGNKHISSGLYIVTKQVDDINSSGYTTTLTVTRISN